MREGRNESEAVRAALVEAGRPRRQAALVEAGRPRRQAALADEVSRLVEDAADTAERQAIMADMDALSVDWPE